MYSDWIYQVPVEGDGGGDANYGSACNLQVVPGSKNNLQCSA